MSNRKLKIMYVLHTPFGGGGLEVVEIIKANELAERGHEVILCYFYKSRYPWSPRPISDKVRLIHLDVAMTTAFTPRYIPCINNFRRKLQKVVDEERPDVIVSTRSETKYVVAFIKSPKNHTLVKVREFHNGSNVHKYTASLSRFQKLALRLAKVFERTVIPMCYDKSYLLTNKDKQENFPTNSHYDVMHNPLTINVLNTPPIMHIEMDNLIHREKVALFVGRLDDQKYVDSLLRIWAITPKNGWKLKIVGDGAFRSELEKLAVDLKINDSVEFTGWKDNPAEEMSKASLFCLTSRHEGFALVLVEAMACGLPVVSYDLPYGPSDIITDGVDGLLVPYLDEKSFSAKLSELLADEERLHRMSAAAIEKSKKFSVEKIVDQWEEKFMQLLEH